MKLKNNDNHRVDAFQKNIQLEKLLITINNALRCAEERLLSKISIAEAAYPIIFIMGPLRSGTTFFLQWLAFNNIAACPTNLLARFYGAPIVGAYIQLLLTDPRYNFRDEILDFSKSITFESENGKTNGAISPNEFWYFWRRFLPFGELDWMPDDQLFKHVDHARLVEELTSLTRIFQKPFALKGMILNYNIRFLDAIFDNALFVRIKRDYASNVTSIMDARLRQTGDTKTWYSFKIPEYYRLRELEPLLQCAGQCYFINEAVKNGLASVSEDRKLTVQYENFCRNPRKVYYQILEKLSLSDFDYEYRGPEFFKTTRNLNQHQRDTIEKARSKIMKI